MRGGEELPGAAVAAREWQKKGVVEQLPFTSPGASLTLGPSSRNHKSSVDYDANASGKYPRGFSGSNRGSLYDSSHLRNLILV